MTPLQKVRWWMKTGLHAFVGLSALLGGGALAAWPSGKMLRLPVTVLEGSGFTDFLLPGLILYGAVGVMNLLATYCVARGEDGSEFISFIAAAALMLWLGVQTLTLNVSHPMQWVYAAIGILLLVDAVLPGHGEAGLKPVVVR